MSASATIQPLRDSSPISGDTRALAARFRQDGYIYLPGLLPADTVAVTAAELRSVLHGVGWIEDADSLRTPHRNRTFHTPWFADGYRAIQGVESFHRLAFERAIWDVAAGLLGAEIFCHPARVCRLAFPSDDPAEFFSRPHQDFVLLQVSADVLTFWIPLCACTDLRPGLTLVPGSHLGGYRPPVPALGGTRPIYLDAPAEAGWASADYQPGDVVVFHSLLVHGGRTNRGDSLRISADFRYQPLADPIRPEYLRPSGHPRTPDWDVLARSWSSRRWVEVPPEVRTVPLPEGTDLDSYLAALTVPPSRLG
jgi:hypothetical protein